LWHSIATPINANPTQPNPTASYIVADRLILWVGSRRIGIVLAQLLIGAVVDVAKSWLVPRVGYWQRTNAANYCQELGTAKSWLLHQTRCTMQLDL